MPQQQTIALYLDEIQRALEYPEPQQTACRSALKKLLDSFAGFVASADSLRAEIGAPQIMLQHGHVPVGFVETQDAGADLDNRQRDPHIQQLAAALPNFILTNYLEFRWYVFGQMRLQARLGEMQGGKLKRARDGADEALKLLRSFTNQALPVITTTRELGGYLGDMAALLRLLIQRAVTHEAPARDLLEHWRTLRDWLPPMSDEDFAGSLSQTIVYSLFLARLRHQGTGRNQPFQQRDVYWNLPPTAPFLRAFFNTLAGLDTRIAWLVEIITALLANADAKELNRDFARRRRQDDLLVPFYQAFNTHYHDSIIDLPEPLVNFIVRSIDHVLRKRFKRGLGLVSPDIALLDPAAGTGTFLYFIIQHIYDRLRVQRQLGSWDDYVTDHLLPRLTGFEPNLAHYTLAHIKMSLQLEESGYLFASNQRLNVFLTNPLNPPPAVNTSDALAALLQDEQRQATAVKHVTVLLGSALGTESFSDEWITQLLHGQQADGTPAAAYLEADDTQTLPGRDVKLMRFAQWRVENAGSGIMAFITHTAYLDAPPLSLMRQSLLNTFNTLYVLNLHGSGLTPDGQPDESLLEGVREVCVCIFVKTPDKKGITRLHYADVWGTRASKYAYLQDNALSQIRWIDLHPQPPLYVFVPTQGDRLGEYEKGWLLDEIMPFSFPGLDTGTLVDFTQEGLFWRVQAQGLRPPKRADLLECTARPFDWRLAYVGEDTTMHPPFSGRHPNLLLNIAPPANSAVWGHVFVCETLPLAGFAGEGSLAYPLYLYDEQASESPFAPGKDGRRPNLNPKFVQEAATTLGMTFIPDGHGDGKHHFGPEDMFAYAYALFHSPSYRERYAEFWQSGSPRLMLTDDKKLFRSLARKGRKLINLHLLRKAGLWKLMTGFAGQGGNLVEESYPRYTQLAGETGGRVYINESKYFEGVSRDMWDFKVGESQILAEWLKARREHTLPFEDTLHYQHIIVALYETRRVMREIDSLIPGFPLI